MKYYNAAELLILKQRVGGNEFVSYKTLEKLLKPVCKLKLIEVKNELIKNELIKHISGEFYQVVELDKNLVLKVLDRYLSSVKGELKREAMKITREYVSGRLKKEQLIKKLVDYYGINSNLKSLDIERGSVLWYLEKFSIIKKITKTGNYVIVSADKGANYLFNILEKVKGQLRKDNYH